MSGKGQSAGKCDSGSPMVTSSRATTPVIDQSPSVTFKQQASTTSNSSKTSHSSSGNALRKGKIEAIEDILKKLDDNRTANKQQQHSNSNSSSKQNRNNSSNKSLPLKKSERVQLTNKLRQFCITKYGLVSTELRQKSWPIIFGIDIDKLPKKPNRQKVRENQWFNQVKLDVDRSASRIPTNLLPEQKETMQENLMDLILHILCENPDLHYYQGYHDITITILQVCGLRLAMPVAERLTRDYLRDFMQQTMDSTRLVLDLIFPLINEMDPELHHFLKESEVGSYFALSWLLTWYGHVIKDLKRTCRIYDFFIASHPAMPMYLAAEIILHRREEILSTECDMPSVHHLLTSLATVQLPDDELIENAVLVFIEKPPSNIALENDELRFYKDLFMAKQEEQSPGVFDALDSSPVHVGKPNKSAEMRRKAELENESFIVTRRNEFLSRQRSMYRSHRERTITDSSGASGVNNRRGFGRRLGRFLTMASAGAVAVAVVSFWVQHYLGRDVVAGLVS